MIETYARTDTGRVREHNEDNVLCESLPFTDGHLLAVADGMGGHQAGDVASRAALMTLHESVRDVQQNDSRQWAAVLTTAIDRVNREICRTAESRPEYDGMGTTLVAAIVCGNVTVIGNVGDSRAYLVDDQDIRQVTEDHTLVRELVSEGVLTETEAVAHPQRHVISRALGSELDVEPDLFVEELGTRTLLLCSDGLTGEVDDVVIQRTVATTDPLESIGTTLIELANEHGGYDNTSVALARQLSNE